MKLCVNLLTPSCSKRKQISKHHDVAPAIRSSELQIFISRISVNRALATWRQNHPLPLHGGTDLCLACTLGPWWAAYAAPAAARRLQTRRLAAFHFSLVGLPVLFLFFYFFIVLSSLLHFSLPHSPLLCRFLWLSFCFWRRSRDAVDSRQWIAG